MIDDRARAEEKLAKLTDERDRIRRLFTRLDGAVTHHRRDKGIFYDDVDVALYEAAKRILRDYTTGMG